MLEACLALLTMRQTTVVGKDKFSPRIFLDPRIQPASQRWAVTPPPGPCDLRCSGWMFPDQANALSTAMMADPSAITHQTASPICSNTVVI
jgi:hypothetical protein